MSVSVVLFLSCHKEHVSVNNPCVIALDLGDYIGIPKHLLFYVARSHWLDYRNGEYYSEWMIDKDTTEAVGESK